MLGLIVVILFLAIVWGVISAIGTATLQATENSAFSANFKGWDFYISPHTRNVLALNRERGLIALGPVSKPKQYSLDQITQVEVLRDGASVTSTNRGSQIAGAAIGVIAFGGLGLLLGGLTGSKRNQSTVHSIALKVFVDDSAAPAHMIEFFKSPDKKGTDSASGYVKTAAGKLDHYHALLLNALKVQSPSMKVDDAATQIAKLWELKQSGALTEEEFIQQKQRLLAPPPAVNPQS
ncbi:MAG: SHOCT domain-containing protein [Terricaulis sp.]